MVSFLEFGRNAINSKSHPFPNCFLGHGKVSDLQIWVGFPLENLQ
jgi:hypothetical protein